MGKKKIADSIIIRVGAGIREIPRAPAVIAENSVSIHREPDFKQTDDAHSFGVGQKGTMKAGQDEIIN